jgi:ribose transport system substrate-binding protein
MSRVKRMRRFCASSKRGAAVIVALLASAVVVSACGGSDETASNGSSGGGAAEGKKKIVFILPSLGNQAYTRELDGAKAAAAKDPNIELIVAAPGTGIGQANTLIPKIQNAMLQNPDAMVVNGGAARESLVTILKQAAAKGVKIVTFDVEIPEVPVETFVNMDDDYTSALGGEFMKKALPDGGKFGLFSCARTNTVTIGRVRGFYLGLEGWKGWNEKPVQIVDTGCDSGKARTAMENMLTAHPDLAAVYSTTNQDVMGIIKALEAANKTDLVVVAHDTSVESAQAVLEGKFLQADIANPFEEIGGQAVEAAAKAVDGESLPPKILIKSHLVTKENAQEYIDELNQK